MDTLLQLKTSSLMPKLIIYYISKALIRIKKNTAPKFNN
jgi:hypothetical protein